MRPTAVPFVGVPDAGGMAALDAGATLHDDGRVHLSLVNRLRDDELEVHLEGLAGDVIQIRLHGDDPLVGNTLDHPDRIVPVEDRIRLDGTLVLPPHSHTTLVTG